MTPRHILPTSLALLAIGAAGTVVSIDAAILERQQAAADRRALFVADDGDICLPMGGDIKPFCAPVIREAKAEPVRVAVTLETRR